MSDLPTSSVLRPTATQLPIEWYFDPQVYELERRLLFDQGPGYLGHELMVPNVGDYHVIDEQGQGRVLVRNAQGIEIGRAHV